MKKEIRGNKIKALLGAGISSLIIAVTMLILWKKEWRFDAMDYWMRGSMLAGGELPDGSRGIIFPAWLALAIKLGGRKAWFVLNASMTALFCAVLIPRFSKSRDEKTSMLSLRVVVFTVLFCGFFAGLAAYPMSDLPALVCMSGACIFARKALEHEGKNRVRAGYLLATGILSYAAYNIRTIYLFSGAALFLIVIIGTIREMKIGNRTKDQTTDEPLKAGKVSQRILLPAIGGVIAAIPQGLMNLANTGVFSLRVHTAQLMLQEMKLGFIFQRFDFFSGNTTDKMVSTQPPSGVFFLDPASQTILRTEGITDILTWGEWLQAAISRPVDMLVVYARHFVNMIFPCFPQIFVEDLSVPKWPMGILGFTILFLTAFVMIRHCLKSTTGLKYFIPIVLPSLMVIPGAVEYRFCIGLYVFAFYQLCFNTDYRKMATLTRTEKLRTVFVWAVILLLMMAIWGNMLANEGTGALYM